MQGNWQIKRVGSTTGPYLGTILSDAIRKQYTVVDETEVLWQADKQAAGGWREGHSYRFHLAHRPKVIQTNSHLLSSQTQTSLLMCYLFFQIGLIRLKLWEGAQLIADSGNIIGYNLNKDRIWQKKNRISILVYFQR